jgi:hypothetical protein
VKLFLKKTITMIYTYNIRFLCLIFLISFLASNCSKIYCNKLLNPIPINLENDWNGFARYVVKTTSNREEKKTHNSNSSSINNEYEMKATLNRGLGTAYSNVLIKEQFNHCEWYTGTKTCDGYSKEGRAHGESTTNISLNFSEDEEGIISYSFYIPIPECAGSILKTSANGATTEEPIGQDEGIIQVEFHKVQGNPNVLSGYIREETKGENNEVTETILEWSFIKGEIDVFFIVSPENYKTWLPTPTPEIGKPGSILNVNLALKDKNGNTHKIKATAFNLSLVNTSKEPGVCINYPLNENSLSSPDLKFVSEKSYNEGQNLDLIPVNGFTASVQIGAFDGGAYSILEAEAVLEGGLRIRGRLNLEDNELPILLPYRKSSSKIAQHWLQQNNVTTETDEWDAEKSIGNKFHGDGITLYEEYRGVISKGHFKRLDPNKKELGILIEKNDLELFKSGFELFTQAAAIKIIPFYPNEIASNRQLNSHTQYPSQHKQFVQRLIIAPIEGPIVGENRPTNISNKTPKLSEETVIDIEKIQRLYQSQKAIFDKAGLQIPYTESDEISNTIAHEIAHGIGAFHHGDNSTVIPRTAQNISRIPFKLFDTFGDPYPIPIEGINLSYGIGDSNGNESSGDLNCIMAYTTRYAWHFEQDIDKTLVYRMVPPLKPGTTFCTSPKGTGINNNGFFKDAKRGNCLAQLKVKDH